MAKKNIILSNGDSRVTSTSSFGYDDVTGEVTADNISIGEIKLQGAGTGLISATNGNISAGVIPGASGSTLQFDGTNWVSVEETPQFIIGQAGGDLEGQFPNPTVKNISNVTEGLLAVDYGGTGADLTSTNGALLVYSNGAFRELEADPSLVGSIVTTKGGKWGVTVPKNLYPNVQFFTSSGTWSNSHSASFARVLVQGGGGAGGNGPKETTTYTPAGGGGSGGWADVTFPVYNVTGAVVTVGAGGAQKEAASVAGNSGGQSVFGVSGQDIYVYANGGTGGNAGSTTVAAAAGGAAGATSTNVITRTGVAGAAYNVNGVAGIDISTGGGLPYTYLGANPTYGPGSISSFLNGTKNFGYGADSDGNIIGKLIASGAVGANPSLIQSEQKIDPYTLLHMEPFYEKTVDVQKSSFSTYDVTLNGAASFQNTVSKWGGYAPTFRSGSAYGAVNISPGYAVGTGDFTIEFWLYLNSTGSAGDANWKMQLGDTRAASSITTSNYEMLISTVGNRVSFRSSNASVTGSTSININTWHHVAYVRQSGVLSIYLNGARETTSNLFSTNSFNSGYITLGNYSATPTTIGYNLDGYIDNYRLSNTARYTGTTYTVPTAAFENDANTIILVAPTTTAISPAQTSIPTAQSYNPVISYNGAAGFTNENSKFAGGYSLKPMLNNNSGSYNTGSITVTPGYSLGTADFTAEAWVYLNSTGSNPASGPKIMYLYDTRAGTSAATKHNVSIFNGKLNFYTGTGVTSTLTSSLSVSTGYWQHIALVRQNNVFRFYINGEQDINSVVNTNSLTDTTSIIIGNSSAPSEAQYSLDGYINNFQIVKGAKYTGNYQVPTAPFVKDNNTVILINGAPYDKAITNATVDSSYHGRTVTFNGAANLTSVPTAFGDTGYVLSPMSATNKTGSITVTPGQFLGTSDFTAEAWVYLNNTGSNTLGTSTNRMFLYDTRNGTGNTTRHFVGFATGGKLGLYTGGGAALTLTSSNTVPTGSWQHVAMTRQNNVFRFYINGVLDTNSVTNTNNFSEGTNIIIGGSSVASEAPHSLDGYIDEFRITPKALYTTSFVTSSVRFSDPYNPLLLLHMEPVSGNLKSTVDSSKWNRDVQFTGISAVGSASLSASGNPFSQNGYSLAVTNATSSIGSLLLNGNMTATGTGPFTFEAWIYQTSRSSSGAAIFDSRANASSDGILLYINPTGQLALWQGTADVWVSNRVIPLNKWTHVAMVRNGSLTGGTHFYIDGVRDTKAPLTITANYNRLIAQVGSAHNVASDVWNFKGSMDEVRLSKTVLYTGSYFPVPTAPFPDPSNYTVSKIAAGKSGQYGSGGGGGGNTSGVLQDLNRGYMGGKGGDGYVLVISW